MSGSSNSMITKLVDRVFPVMPDFYGLMNEQCDVLVDAMEALVQYMEDGSEEKRWLSGRLKKRGDELKGPQHRCSESRLCHTHGPGGYLPCHSYAGYGHELRQDNHPELEVLGLSPDKYMLEMAVEYKNAAQALQQDSTD